MTMSITVAIDARLPEQGQGGVQQVIHSLAQGMREVDFPTVRRVWVVLRGTTWWRDIFPSCDDIIEVQGPGGSLSARFASKFPGLASALYPLIAQFGSTNISYDSLLSRMNVQLVHFPFQEGFSTNLPYIYTPHDLQHKYFPEFFSRSQIQHRERRWRMLACNAQVVMAASEIVAKDLRSYWAISPESISIVPIPPPNPGRDDGSVPKRFPDRYCFYPAVFWPHKNHATLIMAIGLLRDRGTPLKLVLSGAQIGIYREIRQLVDQLDLRSYVEFVGHVTRPQLQSYYSAAWCVVVPSFFEALSLVVAEAQIRGIPVICSDSPTFRKQVGDSALVVDSTSPFQIAEALRSLSESNELYESLSRGGRARTESFTCRNYALAMIGQYFQVIGHEVPQICESAANDLRNLFVN